MYPGWCLVHEVWTELLSSVYALGWDPVSRALSDPEEVCVFYCLTLIVFWGCFSTAFFLFLVAGFANARNITRAGNYFMGHSNDNDEGEDGVEQEQGSSRRRQPESTPEPKKTR